MNEVVITWEMIVPHMLFERVVVGIIGIVMFIHFLCMAAAAPPKSPNIVMLFLMAIVFSSIGMMAAAVFGNISAMWALLIGGVGSMLVFWLWLWYEGMHVKDFLTKKYQ